MVVSKVRLPLMNLEQLLKVVRPCQILDPDRLLDAIEEKTTSKNLLYRGALCMSKSFNCICENLEIDLNNFYFVSGPEENVASAKFNSKTIRGELRSALLDGEVTSYDMEKGTASFFIESNNN